ncbi:MAG: hypothetical protein QGG54_16525, partial [Gammaproteobacteria bacterium]|nr:hypothetical protein [Gammaproteobacteria bacterium]
RLLSDDIAETIIGQPQCKTSYHVAVYDQNTRWWKGSRYIDGSGPVRECILCTGLNPVDGPVYGVIIEFPDKRIAIPPEDEDAFTTSQQAPNTAAAADFQLGQCWRVSDAARGYR